MIFLEKIYSEPEGLFEPVKFERGINFIYAKKDSDKDKKKSLNGLGKSLFLNLIDFCLLSSETRHIKVAKEKLDLSKYRVVLEFSVDTVHYLIKRSFADPDYDIQFGRIDEELQSYKNTTGDKELRRKLCDLFFLNKSYQGKYSNLWLRQLMPFFIKKQSSKTKVNFQDPIRYLYDSASEMELVPYHLFLMGIDNTFSYQNYSISTEIKAKKPALKEVELLVQEKYGMKNIAHAESEIDKLKGYVNKYQTDIKQFELAKQYRDVEEEANALTEKIKELWLASASDRSRIDQYRESFMLSDDVNTKKIEKLYGELNELLAGNIKRTLDEAITFRREIVKSREEFLAQEIVRLEKNISGRGHELEVLQGERAGLLEFLAAKEAIKDLSQAYLHLSHKQNELADLEGSIRTYRDLKTEVAEREAAIAELYAKIEGFAVKFRDELSEFRKVFFEVHDAIYADDEGQADFIFTPNSKKESRFDIDVILPSELSYGKNRGRSLVYDLAILFHAKEQGVRCPRFLIHDGIFDGIDKAHFVHLIKFLELKEKESPDFQYIVTLNQEGQIKDDDFGDGAEKLSETGIEDRAILTLTPKTPLFGVKW